MRFLIFVILFAFSEAVPTDHFSSSGNGELNDVDDQPPIDPENNFPQDNPPLIPGDGEQVEDEVLVKDEGPMEDEEQKEDERRSEEDPSKSESDGEDEPVEDLEKKEEDDKKKRRHKFMIDFPFVIELGQIKRYFKQLQDALNREFQHTLNEAIEVKNGTSVSESVEEDKDGNKFVVHKTVVKSGDGEANSSVLIETVSTLDNTRKKRSNNDAQPIQ